LAVNRFVTTVSVIGIALALLLRAGGAAAQTDEEKAKKHFQQGATLYNEGSYTAALIELKQSFKLKPNWKVRFYIGVALQALNRFVEAEKELKLYLEEGGAGVPADKKAQAEDIVSQLSGLIGSIVIVADTAGAAVTVNGKPAGTTPLAQALRLDIGHYAISLKKEGHEDFSTEVELPGGETVTVEAKLEKTGGEAKKEPAAVAKGPEPAVKEPEAKKEPAPPPKEEKKAAAAAAQGKKAGGKKLKPGAFYGLVAVTGLSAVGVVVAGVLAMKKHQSFEETPESDWQKRRDLKDEGVTLNVAADVLVGVGAASALAMIVVGALTDFGRAEKKKGAALLAPSAGVLPGGAGVALSGRF